MIHVLDPRRPLLTLCDRAVSPSGIYVRIGSAEHSDCLTCQTQASQILEGLKK